VVKEMGLERRGLVEEDLIGYIAAFLDGIWLKAPYLHNGSVPSLRDLLEPAAQRPKVFWRGYDVYDQTKVGFVSDTPAAQRRRHQARHREQGGRQPGARVRDGLVGGGKGRSRRIPENALGGWKRCMPRNRDSADHRIASDLTG
jgi:hypothetical protein